MAVEGGGCQLVRARAEESTRGKEDARDRHITINQHGIEDCRYVDYFIFILSIFRLEFLVLFILSLHSRHFFLLHLSFCGIRYIHLFSPFGN